jgi:hypothetical protein
MTLVTALALERRVCLGCLVDHTGATTRVLDVTISRIRRVLGVHEDVGRCHCCRDVGSVVSFERPRGD